MNKDLFRFKHRPFAAAPDVVNYVPTESIESALETVTTGVTRAAGPAVVIGPAGLGKSMFCVELANRLRHSHEIVLLSTSRLCTRRALLQNVLYELGLPYRESEEGELRLSLLEHLKSPQASTEGMLLIVDEAHTMPLRLLEEIRGLTNIHRQGQTRVHLALVGTQLLDERLTSPKMEAFTQRIAARCYLHPMNRDETKRFITQQWYQASADGAAVPFNAEALEAVYSATDGIPRLVNQVCDHTLLLASVRLLKRFGVELVEEAWSDLQQLPTPWQVNFRENQADQGQGQAVVEFGTLNEEFAIDNDREIEHGSVQQLAMERLDEIDDLAQQASDLDLGLSDSPTPTPTPAESDGSTRHGDLEPQSEAAEDLPETRLSLEEPEASFDDTEISLDDSATAENDTTLASDSELGDIPLEPASTFPAESFGPWESPESPGEQPDSSWLEAVDQEAQLAPKPTSDIDIAAALESPVASGLETDEAAEPEASIDIAANLDLDEIAENTAETFEEPERVIVLDPFADDDFDLEELVTEQREPPTRKRSNPELTNTTSRDTEFTDLGTSAGLEEPLPAVPPSDDAGVADNETGAIESTLDIRNDLLPNPAELAPNPSAPANTPTIPEDDYLPLSPSNVDGNTDDKDLIVIDNPLPKGSFRVIGQAEQQEGAKEEPTQGVAYREDYQALLNRLRGSIKS